MSQPKENKRQTEKSEPTRCLTVNNQDSAQKPKGTSAHMSQEQVVPTDWLVTHQLSETDFIYQIIPGEETFKSGFTILKNSVKTFSYQEREMPYPPETFIAITDGKLNWELSIIHYPNFKNKREKEILELLDPYNFENRIYFNWIYKIIIPLIFFN